MSDREQPHIEETNSDTEDSAPQPQPQSQPPPPQRRKGKSRRRQGGSRGGPLGGGSPLDAVGGLTNAPNQALGQVGDTVNGVGDTAKGLIGGATGALGGGAKKEESGDKDTLRLRLDLNLEIEVTLKARIHGDLTLALLQ